MEVGKTQAKAYVVSPEDPSSNMPILTSSQRRAILAIIRAEYSPYDVREFVRLCFHVSLPLIRKKIRLGRINLQILGLTEKEISHDCLADLFERDEHGRFVLIERFFSTQLECADSADDGELLSTLRRLVFGKVNQNLVHIHADADASLGKILRNVRISVGKLELFEEIERFGDTYIVARGADPLFHRPPIDFDVLRDRFCRIALIHDNTPTMLTKLHHILVTQCDYQRVVRVISACLVFRDLYALGRDAGETSVIPSEMGRSVPELSKMIEEVCVEICEKARTIYVTTQKCTEEEIRQYVMSIRDHLLETVNEHQGGDKTLFDYLGRHMRQLTKAEYHARHRFVLEYLAKLARESLRERVAEQ